MLAVQISNKPAIQLICIKVKEEKKRERKKRKDDPGTESRNYINLASILNIEEQFVASDS